MARAITKTFNGSQTIVTVVRIDNGEMVEEQVVLNGSKSDRAAQAAIKAAFKTSNFMVKSIERKQGEDTQSYSVDAYDFYLNGDFCKADTTYGHDTVTATLKLTVAKFVNVKMEESEYTYFGVTTDNKLRNAIISECGDANILVVSKKIEEVRMWMSKDAFIELATKDEQTDDENGE